MNDQRLGQLVGAWLQESCVPANDPREGVREVVTQTADMRQVGAGWLSRLLDDEVVPVRVSATSGRQPARGSTMFSALKLIAASVIVALFGGFLLAGLLVTQRGDEMAPATVTDSPSPKTTEALLSGMVTEEVEPGVFRVINDGIRDLSLPTPDWGAASFAVDVAPDGSVWLSANGVGQDLFRLGEERVFEGPTAFPVYREVAPDGSLWAIGDYPDNRSIFSFDGEEWTVRATTTADFISALAIGPDGTIWVVGVDGHKHCPDIEDRDCSGTVLLRLEGDGSLTTIEDWADVQAGDASPTQLAVSPDGDVWLAGTRGVLLRFDGEGWEAVPGPEGWDPAEIGRYLDVGPDGALWVQADTMGGLARFDDPGWTTFMPADGPMQGWGEQGWTTMDLLEVASDGSLWLNGGPPGTGCGMTHYHDMTWTSYLVGSCIEDFAIAPDGSVWLGAADTAGLLDLYVITPEAVAGTE